MGDADTPPSKPPPPPPPKRLSRPKITLQIPDTPTPQISKGPQTAASVYWAPNRYHGKVPATPASHISDPHGNPYFNPFLYHNKASEFMFKQFAGFKDFTMNTAKSGLSAGEKSAFWFYNKLRALSKKWFTHFFLTLCLVLYSVMGAAIFMAIEGPSEEKFVKNLTTVRKDFAVRVEEIWSRRLHEKKFDFLALIEQDLATYEQNFTELSKHLNGNTKTWGFWNSMFYAGTIYTTIEQTDSILQALDNSRQCLLRQRVRRNRVMSEEGHEDRSRFTLIIPTIKAESETQTLGHLVSKTPDRMEAPDQKMSIRKRRNLSKNRGQAARQREKTPEPGRTPVPHEDTTTSDDEECPPKNSRELEADKTYEEMKRLVQEKANAKDPVYDMDIDEVLEQRAMAANERRRRSISPFALPDKEEMCKLQRKGSFIDPTNKLLSTSYNLSPKDEDLGRRNSLTIDTPKERRCSLTPPTTASPQDRNAGFAYPTTPKKLEKIVYPDEVTTNPTEEKTKMLSTPVKKEHVFTFDEKDQTSSKKTGVSKTAETTATPGEIITKPVQLERTPSKKITKAPETPETSGEIVTRVIQLERTPSKKLTAENKPEVQVVRERIVRTPSRKMSSDIKPVLTKPHPPKPTEESQPKLPPVKPARSKSASRMGRKTSESDMSEDQGPQAGARRKLVPTPRRFVKNRSPRANRSQSVHRVEDVKVIDRAGTEMSQTSKDILELMQKRARSLSIPKDDPKLLAEYKCRTLQTPSRTTPSTSRTSRGISCPKTIQIISDKQILAGLTTNKRIAIEKDKNRNTKQSGYVDASQSEYTSSCYSTSPSENEYEFDLAERTAELTRKLKLLSQESEDREFTNMEHTDNINNNNVLRKRNKENKNGIMKGRRESATEERKVKSKIDEEKKKIIRSRWRLIANWQQFKQEHRTEYNKLLLLRNKCICDLILIVIMCGLGGMLFKSLEGSFENAYKCGTRNVKRDFIESLWRGSHYLREEDWKSMARKKLYEFEDQLHTAHEAGVSSYSGLRSWSFMNSFVYCLTLITTIGYGHIAPKTTYGRVATIVYAVIGIPLFLIVLADFGKLFTRIIKFFWAFIRRFYYTRSCRKVRRTVPMQEMMKGLNIVYDVVRRPSQIFSEEDLQIDPATGQPPPLERKPSDVPPPLPPKPGQVIDMENETEPTTPAPSVFEIDDEFNLPISVAIFILVIYIVVGALGYNIWEKWDFFESFYFVFISMSTIGLGDLVPDHPMFMMASILYLVFGLALTSMCINVVQVKLSDTFKKASAKLGATIGLQVAEEDGSLVPITPTPVEVAPVHKSKSEREEDKNKNAETKSKETNDVDSKNR